MQILQNNGIDRINIDDAILNNLNAGYETGIVKSYNNFNIIKATSNIISIDTGVLLIYGCPVKNTSIFNISFNNFPVTSEQYKLIATLELVSGVYSFNIEYVAFDTVLIKNDLYAENGGKYQKELARFTLTQNGITDFIQTVDVLVNKGGKGYGGLNIGTVTTITQESGTDAVVDIENRLDEQTGIIYTDFNFGIPDAVSITGIERTGTAGLVDTYTITYNNNTTSTFTVSNGFSPTATVEKVGDTTTITITDENGTTTAEVFDGMTLDTDQTITGEKTFYSTDKLKVRVNDNDVRKVVLVPTGTTNEKRFLYGGQNDSSFVGLNNGCYMENGKVYSNSTETAIRVAGNSSSVFGGAITETTTPDDMFNLMQHNSELSMYCGSTNNTTPTALLPAGVGNYGCFKAYKFDNFRGVIKYSITANGDSKFYEYDWNPGQVCSWVEISQTKIYETLSDLLGTDTTQQLTIIEVVNAMATNSILFATKTTGEYILVDNATGVPNTWGQIKIEKTASYRATLEFSYCSSTSNQVFYTAMMNDGAFSGWNEMPKIEDIPTNLSQLTEDTTHRVVTDTEKTTWNNKANTSDLPTGATQTTLGTVKAWATTVDGKTQLNISTT